MNYDRVLAISIVILMSLSMMRFGTIQHIYLHEQEHFNAYRGYGIATNMSVDWVNLVGMTYSADENQTLRWAKLSPEEHENLNMINNLNDIIGYNNISLIINLWLMLPVMIIGLLVARWVK